MQRSCTNICFFLHPLFKEIVVSKLGKIAIFNLYDILSVEYTDKMYTIFTDITSCTTWTKKNKNIHTDTIARDLVTIVSKEELLLAITIYFNCRSFTIPVHKCKNLWVNTLFFCNILYTRHIPMSHTHINMNRN